MKVEITCYGQPRGEKFFKALHVAKTGSGSSVGRVTIVGKWARLSVLLKG